MCGLQTLVKFDQQDMGTGCLAIVHICCSHDLLFLLMRCSSRSHSKSLAVPEFNPAAFTRSAWLPLAASLGALLQICVPHDAGVRSGVSILAGDRIKTARDRRLRSEEWRQRLTTLCVRTWGLAASNYQWPSEKMDTEDRHQN